MPLNIQRTQTNRRWLATAISTHIRLRLTPILWLVMVLSMATTENDIIWGQGYATALLYHRGALTWIFEAVLGRIQGEIRHFAYIHHWRRSSFTAAWSIKSDILTQTTFMQSKIPRIRILKVRNASSSSFYNCHQRAESCHKYLH